MKKLKILIIIVALIIAGHSYSSAIDINSWEDLGKIGNDGAYPLNGSYTLTTNLTAAGAPSNFTPIGDATNKFTGTFSGGGYEIHGLTINHSGDYTGLFGYVQNTGYISNAALIDVNVTGSGKYVGGLIGYRATGGFATNNYVTGEVTSTSGAWGSAVGGLIGENRSTSTHPDHSYSAATVTGGSITTYVGGLIGRGYIRNSSASVAKVYGSDGSNIGGVAGYANSVYPNTMWYDLPGDNADHAYYAGFGGVYPREAAFSNTDPPDNYTSSNFLMLLRSLIYDLGIIYSPNEINLLVTLYTSPTHTPVELTDSTGYTTTWTYYSEDREYGLGVGWTAGGKIGVNLGSGIEANGPTAVPEPATVISFIIGGAGIAAKRFFPKKRPKTL